MRLGNSTIFKPIHRNIMKRFSSPIVCLMNKYEMRLESFNIQNLFIIQASGKPKRKNNCERNGKCLLAFCFILLQHRHLSAREFIDAVDIVGCNGN